MSEIIVIYALQDPRDWLFRYVGQTQDTKVRYAGHLSSPDGNKQKREWIADLRSSEAKPVMVELERVPPELADETEKAHTLRLLNAGHPIFSSPDRCYYRSGYQRRTDIVKETAIEPSRIDLSFPDTEGDALASLGLSEEAREMLKPAISKAQAPIGNILEQVIRYAKARSDEAKKSVNKSGGKQHETYHDITIRFTSHGDWLLRHLPGATGEDISTLLTRLLSAEFSRLRDQRIPKDPFGE